MALLEIGRKPYVYKKTIDEKPYELHFFMNNIDILKANKLARNLPTAAGQNTDYDIHEFCFDLCVIALKKTKGFKEPLDMKNEDVRTGILAVKELIDLDDIRDIAFEVRGLGEALAAIKSSADTSVDSSSSELQKKNVESVEKKTPGSGKSAKEPASVK